jgi:hypothetical protein
MTGILAARSSTPNPIIFAVKELYKAFAVA